MKCPSGVTKWQKAAELCPDAVVEIIPGSAEGAAVRLEDSPAAGAVHGVTVYLRLGFQLSMCIVSLNLPHITGCCLSCVACATFCAT